LSNTAKKLEVMQTPEIYINALYVTHRETIKSHVLPYDYFCNTMSRYHKKESSLQINPLINEDSEEKIVS
jgi:hypothetical protein